MGKNKQKESVWMFKLKSPEYKVSKFQSAAWTWGIQHFKPVKNSTRKNIKAKTLKAYILWKHTINV